MNYKNPAVLSLLLANVITIIFAVTQSWSIYPVLWIYWAQGVIIGIVHSIRIRRLENSLHIWVSGLFPSAVSKTWLLFALYYFTFHIGLFVFLTGATPINVEIGSGEIPIYIWDIAGQSEALSSIDIALVAFAAAVFLANHIYSLKYYWKKPKIDKYRVQEALGYPLLRILPMFLIAGIAAMAGPGNMLVFFLVVKTAIDLLMHSAEHRLGWI